MPPLVSILVPTYRGECYIAQAIDSALAQTYSHFELLIVNDGSPDRVVEVIQPYLTDTRVKYFEQPNAGVAAARNTALGHAKGKYVGFLDQDDEWLPHKLALQVEYLEAHPDIALVHGRQDCVDNDGQLLADDFINIEPISGHCFPQLFEKNRIAVLTVLIRHAAIREAGGFNPRASRADDYELWLRVTLRHPIAFLDQVVARYRVHGTNASHDAFQMTEADLVVMDSIMSQRMLVAAQVGSASIRGRLAALHRELGEWQMWKMQDFPQAKHHFTQALRNDPFTPASWRALLWCTLAPSQRTALSWWSTRLRCKLRGRTTSRN